MNLGYPSHSDPEPAGGEEQTVSAAFDGTGHCHARLRSAFDVVSDLTREPSAWKQSVELVLAALDCFDDANEAVAALEALVDDRRSEWLADAAAVTVESRADSYESYRVRWYCAVVEDLYLDLGIPILAWEAREAAGLVALDLDRLEEAEGYLRDAAAALSDYPDLYAGRPWHLVALSLERQGRNQEAADLYARAAAVSQEHEGHAMAAESLDAQANLLVHDDLRAAYEAFSQAEECWQTAGDEDEARGSRVAAGWAARSLAQFAHERGDDGEWMRYAAIALAAGEGGEDELLATLAALQVGLFSVSRAAEPARTVELLERRVGVLDRLGEPQDEALLLAVLAIAHGQLTNLTTADRLLRRSLALADSLDAETVASLAELLASLATARFDGTSTRTLMRLVGGDRLGGNEAGNDGLDRMLQSFASGDYVGASERAEALAATRWVEGDSTGEAQSALLLLLMFDALLGNGAAAERHVQELQKLIRISGASLTGYERLSQNAILPYASALAAEAHGDHDTFERVLMERYEQCLTLGLGETAARTAAVLGMFALKAGRPLDALSLLLPASIGLSWLLVSLPSSAERRSLRDAMQQADHSIIQIIAQSGGATLLSEYLEVARAQGMPESADAETDGDRSIASLVTLTWGAAVESEAWVQQATLLPRPPLVRMPWGAVACERYVEAAEPYAAASWRSAPALVVPLIVPR